MLSRTNVSHDSFVGELGWCCHELVCHTIASSDTNYCHQLAAQRNQTWFVCGSRTVVSLFLSLFSLSIFLSLCLSVSLSFCSHSLSLFCSLSLSLSLFRSFALARYLSLSVSPSPFLSLFSSLFLFLALSLSFSMIPSFDTKHRYKE